MSEYEDYRRGIESGTMKSATPNVVRGLLSDIDDLQTLNAELLAACKRGELHLKLCSPNTAAHKQLKRAISEATEKLL